MKAKPMAPSAAAIKKAAAKAPGRPPGRPPKGSQAMTHAERQAAYRKRQWRAQLEAEAGKPESQPTGAILNALGFLLRSLDDPQKADLHESQRWAAERAVRELCSRYGLKPISSR